MRQADIQKGGFYIGGKRQPIREVLVSPGFLLSKPRSSATFRVACRVSVGLTHLID
jgi:hypothetical protein